MEAAPRANVTIRCPVKGQCGHCQLSVARRCRDRSLVGLIKNRLFEHAGGCVGGELPPARAARVGNRMPLDSRRVGTETGVCIRTRPEHSLESSSSLTPGSSVVLVMATT